MTRPASSALVLDGSEVKVRLLAERALSKSAVHVDWLRFTVQRRNAATPDADLLFPPAPRQTGVWDERYRQAELARILAELPNDEFSAATQAMELAREVADALGPDFTVSQEMRKGHDFYRHRWSIERNDSEVGWIGFGASSDKPRQQAQAKTLHVNLYGAACTFAAHGWTDRMADIVDERHGDITRTDLALDFFDGFAGGLDRVVEDYKAGVCNSGGKRLKCSTVGDWVNGQERSFYMGSKEAGKQTNVYEKGHQLFGVESGSQWLRVELRYGNKLRVLCSDMLRRPADFFAGASDWHALMLAEADEQAMPEPVKTTGRLALETVEAEVTRNLRWLRDTASATFAFAIRHLDVDQLHDLSGTTKLPGRLRSFSSAELVRATQSAVHRFIQPTADAGHVMQGSQPLAA